MRQDISLVDMCNVSCPDPTRTFAAGWNCSPLVAETTGFGRSKKSRHTQLRGASRDTFCSIHSPERPVRTDDTPAGRGLVTSQKVEISSCLLEAKLNEVLAVPGSVLAHKRVAKATLTAAKAAYQEMPKHLLQFVQGSQHAAVRLAAALLWLRKHGTPFWQEYIACLPQEPDMTCLLNYMPDEQSELQWLAAQAEMEHLQAQHFHDTLFSSTSGCLRTWKLANQLQDTLWALSVVYSRALTHEVPETQYNLSMLVPRLDLANHSFDANADWTLDFSRGVLKLTATQDLAENEPVCIDYGPDLDNAHLMRVFGFTVPGNPNDRLAFLEQQRKVALSNIPSLSRTQVQQPVPSLLAGPFCKAAGLDTIVNSYKQSSWTHDGQGIVSCHEDANLSRKFSAMLSLPGCAAEHFWPGQGDGRLPSQNCPGSHIRLGRQQAHQQLQLAQDLQSQCQAVLSSYATSASTDQELLQRQQSFTPRYVQAIKARLEHKLLVSTAIELLVLYASAMGHNQNESEAGNCLS